MCSRRVLWARRLVDGGHSSSICISAYLRRWIPACLEVLTATTGPHPRHPPNLRRMDPLWNSLVVGGFYGGKPFLGTVGMIGTNYTDVHVATGKHADREGQNTAWLVAGKLGQRVA